MYTHALNSYSIAVGTRPQARAGNAKRAVGTAPRSLGEKRYACIFSTKIWGHFLFNFFTYALNSSTIAVGTTPQARARNAIRAV